MLIIEHIRIYSRASTWIGKFYVRLARLLSGCEEGNMWSHDQEKKDVNGTGKVEHGIAKKDSRRWYTLVTE